MTCLQSCFIPLSGCQRCSSPVPNISLGCFIFFLSFLFSFFLFFCHSRLNKLTCSGSGAGTQTSCLLSDWGPGFSREVVVGVGGQTLWDGSSSSKHTLDLALSSGLLSFLSYFPWPALSIVGPSLTETVLSLLSDL